MYTISHPFHILFISILLSILQPAQSFASWFVERQSSCWIQLRDTKSEVVMNSFIVSHQESSHPNVKMQAYDTDTKELVPMDDNKIYIDSTSSTIHKKYTIVFNQDDDLKDLQYVMDIQVSPELDDDVIQKLTGEEARIQARFLSPTKGCTGDSRAHGRGHDDGLVMEIVIPESVFALDDLEQNSVDLVAGWACGHEPVTLTQNIVFVPRKAGATGWTTEQQEIPQDGAVAVEEEEVLEAIVEKSEPIDAMTQEHAEEHDHGAQHVDQGPKPQVYTEEKQELRHKKRKHDRNEVDREFPLKEVKEFQKKYDNDDFGKAKFTSNSYLVGVLVFIFVGGTVLNAILAMSGGRRSKSNHVL